MATRLSLLNTPLILLKRWRIFPFVFQLFFFGCLGLTLYSLATPDYLKSLNVGMVVLWHIWWPAIPFLIFFFGRLWCTICPFGATANVINRIFPFALLPSERLQRHRVFWGLLAFCLIVSVDNIYALASFQHGSFLFLLVLYGLLVVLSIVFDHTAYCNLLCPFGLMATLYRPFTLLVMRHDSSSCGACRRESWLVVRPVGLATRGAIHGSDGSGQRSSDTSDNWRVNVECVKRCPENGTGLALRNPLAQLGHVAVADMYTALAPAVIIAMLTVSVFFRSALMTRYYLLLYRQIDISFELFQLLVGALFVVLSVGVHVLLIWFARNILGVKRTTVLRGLVVLVPLLLFFHFGIALKDVRGITALQYTSGLVCSLGPHIPKKDVMQLFSYGLAMFGICLGLVALFRFYRHRESVRNLSFGSFASLLLAVVSVNGLLALTTTRYMQFFG